MTVSTGKPHLVVVTGPGWGHVRPCVQTGLTFARRAPRVYVTFLAFPDTFDKLSLEMSRQSHLQPEVMDRLQWLEVKPKEGEDGPMSGYTQIFEGLIVPGKKETVGSKIDSPPSLIINDVLPGSTSKTVRAVCDAHSQPYVPCFFIEPMPAGGCLRFAGKEEYGGRYERFEELLEKYEKEGYEASEANRKAFTRMEGKMLTTPDLPPMYDYELHPGIYSRSFPGRVGPRVRAQLMGREDCDGFITVGVPEMEPVSCDLLAKSVRPQELFSIGPQLDLYAWNAYSPKVRERYTGEEKQIIRFLDEAASRHGPKSLAYFCLGSQWWPDDRPELIQYLVETLLEARPPLPFLISASAEKAGISDKLRERVEESGMGMIVSWVPQLTVLQHESVRFFISHCGGGSTVEAIMGGVPMVAWPFTADQPVWATIVCRQYKAGIQLYQVNSGMKGLPLSTGGIVHETEQAIKDEMRTAWDIMRSDRYEEMREGMKKL